MGELGKAMGGAARSAAGIGVAYTKMAGSLLVQSAATAGKSIFGMIGGMVGMGGTAGAVIAGAAALGIGVKTARDSTASTFDPTRARNITNTNEALGIATEPVKDFASAVIEADKSVRKVTTALQGMTLSAGEVLAAQTREPVDKTFKDLRGPEQAVAYIKSMGELNGEQARSLAMDAVSQFGPALGEMVRQQVMQQTGNLENMGGTDVQGALLKGAQGSQSDTWLGKAAGIYNFAGQTGGLPGGIGALVGGSPWMDEGAKNQINASIGAMWSEYSDTTTKKGGETGSQALATRLMEAGDAIFSDNSKSGKMIQDAFLKAIEKNFTGGKELGVGMNPFTGGATLNGVQISNGADFMKAAMRGSTEGTSVLANLLAGTQTGSTADAEKRLAQMQNGEYLSSAERKLRRTQLGTFSRENEAVKAATTGDQMGSPEDISKAVAALYGEVTKNGTSFSDATAKINDFKQGITDIESPLYQLANAVQAAATAQMQISATRSGHGQLGVLENQLQETNTKIATGDYRTSEDLTTLQTNRKAQLLQRDQMVADFTKSTQDMNIGITRMNDDYQLSVQNSWADFGRQMDRSMGDFNRSISRAAEDAAKSMYNPFLRVTNPGSASSGAIVANMQEQAGLIEEQLKNLARAKKMGLKQSTIDQLDLTNPAQAFQLETIVETGGQDVGRLNTVADRVRKDAGRLQGTQQNTRRAKEDNQRQREYSSEDFIIQLDRGEAAIKKAHKRQIEDWARYGLDLIDTTTVTYGAMKDEVMKALGSTSEAVQKEILANTNFLYNRLNELKGLGDSSAPEPQPNKPRIGPGEFNRDRTKWEDPAYQRYWAEKDRTDRGNGGYIPWTGVKGGQSANDNPWGVNPDQVPWLNGGTPTRADAGSVRTSGTATPKAYVAQGGTVITTTNSWYVDKVMAQDITDMERQLAEKARLANRRKGANAKIG
jgi:hypothetical protein